MRRCYDTTRWCWNRWRLRLHHTSPDRAPIYLF
jgi:hypothetical protein